MLLAAREKQRADYLLGQSSYRQFRAVPFNPTIKENNPAPVSAGVNKVSYLRESLQLLVLLFFLMAIGVGLISQYGRIVACNYHLHQLQKEMALLQEEKESLCIEVQRLGALERIERIALGELGLQYPDRKQWLVLSTSGRGF